MFNFVNNPFGQKINMTFKMNQDKKQNKQKQSKNEHNYLEDEDKDNVNISQLPFLTEEEIITFVQNYISNLKTEHADNNKIIEKLDKYLKKFDVKKFMKDNPNITSADLHMILYNETLDLLL